MWFLVERATPLLNNPDFRLVFGGKTGSDVDLSHLELTAIPNMVLELVEKRENIGMIRLSGYDKFPLYVDLRFGSISYQLPQKLSLKCSREQILESMEKRIGLPYVWGGNWSAGIPELLSLYPPSSPIADTTKSLWTLKGLDCSGLLFEASHGMTPRNTSQLCSFGKPLQLSHLSLDKICSLLEPLDMIVYPGHVLFVRDSNTTIESRSSYHGVKTTSIQERLQELLQTRTLVDTWEQPQNRHSSFMIRRMSWHHDALFS